MKITRLLKVMALTVALLISAIGHSDDVELFYQQEAKVNILFLIDTAGDVSSEVDKEKVRSITAALSKVISDASGEVNMGIMRWDEKNLRIGKILHPIRNLNSDASGNSSDADIRSVREALIDTLSAMMPNGHRPFTRALLDAGYYFNGQKLKNHIAYGLSSASLQCDSEAKTRTICYQAGADYWYKKPANSSCSHNFIVLIADGTAEYADTIDYPFSEWATADSRSFLGMSPSSACLQSVQAGTTTNAAENCGVDIISKLRSGAANVKTHTIAYTATNAPFDTAFLQKIASAGGGKFAVASDQQKLIETLRKTLDDMNPSTVVQNPFTASTTFLDSSMKLKHSDKVVLPLLNTTHKYSWEGNLNQYRMAHDGLVDKNGTPLYSSSSSTNGKKFTINEETVDYLQLNNASQLNFITKGGVESHFDVNNRTLYWDSSAMQLSPLTNNASFEQHIQQAGLSDKLNAIGVDSAGVVRWLQGFAYDPTLKTVSHTVKRHIMGDILHGSPVAVEFNGKTLLISATNAGVLHVFNATESDPHYGDEVFSFVANRFFLDIDKRISNQASWSHAYGIDGTVSASLSESGDTLSLFFGLRRGGSALYAIEISRDMVPRLLWIKDESSSDFSRLGQSWSQPIVSKIAGKSVLIFGGGYDTKNDYLLEVKPALGNAIYIMDASNGNVLWSTHKNKPSNGSWVTNFESEMQYSIASNIAVIDINGDGNADQLYATDMGGQVWRFDIHENWEITGGLIAKLSATTNKIKLYNTPDVAIVINGPQRYLSVSFGSGWRENPFDNRIQDYFFSLKQNLAPQWGYPTDVITIDELIDAPSSSSSNYFEKLLQVKDQSPLGWKYRLSHALEKVYSTSLTLDNKILFTTMSPPEVNDACNTPISPDSYPVYRIYALDLKSSAPFVDFDGSGIVEGSCDGERCSAMNLYTSPTAYFKEDALQALVLPLENIDVQHIENAITYWNNHSVD